MGTFKIKPSGSIVTPNVWGKGGSGLIAIQSSGPPLMTNAEKLSLSPSSPTDGSTQVSVSDGFYVSGFGDARDGFYAFSAAQTAIDTGFKSYVNVVAGYSSSPPYGAIIAFKQVEENGAIIFSFQGVPTSTMRSNDGETPANPWSVLIWLDQDDVPLSPQPTLTHPALQQLNAPSSAITGQFVKSAGTTEVNAVYTKRGTSGGKDYYNQLGQATDTTTYSIVWGSLGGIGGTGWRINGNGAVLDYYSLDNVSRPDQVTTWVAINFDQVPTVTSATTGQLIAGLNYDDGGTIYRVNGVQNGRNLYSDVAVVALDIGWDAGHSDWRKSDDTAINLGDVAFPYLGSPAISATRDDVAAEANWTQIP